MTHPHRSVLVGRPAPGRPAPGRPPRPNERGASLSAFVATVVVALLLVGGLVVDGGAQSAAARECQQVAAQAGRAASDAGALERTAGVAPDAAALIRTASEVIAAHPGMTGSVTVSGRVVRVKTTRTVQTTFLSLIRIDSLGAAGEATVELRGTGEGA